jgi:hypothetical protein
MGYQPISPANEPRLRIVVDFRFRAEQFAAAAESFTKIPMDVWRDRAGRWSIAPKETD